MPEINKQTLFQYFEGTASPIQKQFILEWLRDENNKDQFYQVLEEWERSQTQFIPDLAAASARLMTRIDSAGEKSIGQGSVLTVLPRFPYKRVWMIAAAVLLVICSGIYVFRSQIGFVEYRSAYAEVKRFSLPDGSNVILNANSKLLIPRWGFGSSSRVVELEGEAAFFVKHTISDQKFIVHTNGQLNVEVLGTEFSVFSRDSLNKVELKKGSVKLMFSEPSVNPLIMKPGDIVKLNPKGELLVRHGQPATNFIPWKDRKFVFDSSTLEDAVQSIHEFFGDEIVIVQQRLKMKRITGSFTASTSDELLSALSQLFNLEMTRQGDTLFLTEAQNGR